MGSDIHQHRKEFVDMYYLFGSSPLFIPAPGADGAAGQLFGVTKTELHALLEVGNSGAEGRGSEQALIQLVKTGYNMEVATPASHG